MRLTVLALVLALATAGCGVVYRQPIFEGNLLETRNVEQLQVGMSREQVYSLLGTPAISDPFHQDRWDYLASHRREHDPAQIKNLTLWFDNGRLLRWEGEYFPEQDLELAIEMRRFGNLPKEENERRGGGR